MLRLTQGFGRPRGLPMSIVKLSSHMLAELVAQNV